MWLVAVEERIGKLFSLFDYLKIRPCCNLSNSLIFIVERYPIAWGDHNLLMSSTFDGHLGCFKFGVIILNL